MKKTDAVNPQHYRNSAGVQLIEVIRWLPFSLGNAVKYAYRNAQKENAKQDLEKALWYLSDYLRHPSVLPEALVQITPSLLTDVLTGIEDFERDCCEALLRLHEVALAKGDLEAAGEDARRLLERRIEALSETPVSAAPTLF